MEEARLYDAAIAFNKARKGDGEPTTKEVLDWLSSLPMGLEVEAKEIAGIETKIDPTEIGGGQIWSLNDFKGKVPNVLYAIAGKNRKDRDKYTLEVQVDPNDIVVLPDLFQYRRNVERSGRVKGKAQTLGAVYNPPVATGKSDVIIGFVDVEGKWVGAENAGRIVLVDGHQRLALAKKGRAANKDLKVLIQVYFSEYETDKDGNPVFPVYRAKDSGKVAGKEQGINKDQMYAWGSFWNIAKPSMDRKAEKTGVSVVVSEIAGFLHQASVNADMRTTLNLIKSALQFDFQSARTELEVAAKIAGLPENAFNAWNNLWEHIPSDIAGVLADEVRYEINRSRLSGDNAAGIEQTAIRLLNNLANQKAPSYQDLRAQILAGLGRISEGNVQEGLFSDKQLMEVDIRAGLHSAVRKRVSDMKFNAALLKSKAADEMAKELQRQKGAKLSDEEIANVQKQAEERVEAYKNQLAIFDTLRLSTPDIYSDDVIALTKDIVKRGDRIKRDKEGKYVPSKEEIDRLLGAWDKQMAEIAKDPEAVRNIANDTFEEVEPGGLIASYGGWAERFVRSLAGEQSPRVGDSRVRFMATKRAYDSVRRRVIKPEHGAPHNGGNCPPECGGSRRVEKNRVSHKQWETARCLLYGCFENRRSCEIVV